MFILDNALHVAHALVKRLYHQQYLLFGLHLALPRLPDFESYGRRLERGRAQVASMQARIQFAGGSVMAYVGGNDARNLAHARCYSSLDQS